MLTATELTRVPRAQYHSTEYHSTDYTNKFIYL